MATDMTTDWLSHLLAIFQRHKNAVCLNRSRFLLKSKTYLHFRGLFEVVYSSQPFHFDDSKFMWIIHVGHWKGNGQNIKTLGANSVYLYDSFQSFFWSVLKIHSQYSLILNYYIFSFPPFSLPYMSLYKSAWLHSFH